MLSKKGYTLMLKEAYVALLANQNFDYVKTPMGNGTYLTQPPNGRPPEGSLLSLVHRTISHPAPFDRPRLHFNED
jgi:hypothetical protein